MTRQFTLQARLVLEIFLLSAHANLIFNPAATRLPELDCENNILEQELLLLLESGSSYW